MANTINGLGRPPVDIGKSRAQSVDEAGETGQGTAAGRQAAAGDAVSITDAASHLQRVEASLAALPEINAARVEEIRQQVEAGTYRVNAENLADKLIQFELGLV
ncbi:MAG: flagellar biosynthesis anti-sigma factor FlgM [Gammaproteobacteria bacterium]